MVVQRPITTIAICTVTAPTKDGIQQHLSNLFRRALGTKAVIRSECSIDLMIGLLIHLTWQHHYLATPQVYQDMCLLAGMVVDLGLYRPMANSSSNDIAMAVERDRAFLGCYYVCCNLATKGLNKPNPLRRTDNFRRCADNIMRNGNMPSDRNLISLVEFTLVLEDLAEGIQNGSACKREVCKAPNPLCEFL